MVPINLGTIEGTIMWETGNFVDKIDLLLDNLIKLFWPQRDIFATIF